MAKVKPLPAATQQYLQNYTRGQNFRNENPGLRQGDIGKGQYGLNAGQRRKNQQTIEYKKRKARATNPKGALGKVGSAGKSQGFSWSKLGKSALFGALDVVDTPRAAVTAGLGETSDLLVDIFNLPGHEYTDASLREWFKATRDNRSFADTLREKVEAERKATGTNEDLFGFIDTDNPWVAGAVGFGFDVAADPLTYLTAGGAALSRMSKSDMAATAVQHGMDDIALKVSRGGAANLSRGELSELAAKMAAAGDVRAAGMEAGLHFRRPGTGFIGRNTLGRFSKRFAEEQLTAVPRLLGGAGNRAMVGNIATRGIQQTRGTVARTNTYQKFADFLGGSRRPIKRVLATTNDADTFRQAQISLDAMDRGDLVARKVSGELESQLKPLLNRAKEAGVDGATLYHAVGAADNADDFLKVESAAPGLIEEFRQFFAAARNTAHAESGMEFLGDAEFYVPRFRSEKLVEATGVASKAKGPVSGIERGRQLKAGEDWLGQQLMKAADHPRGWSIEQQIESRAREIFGEGNEVFNDDLFEVAERYVMQLGRRTADKFVEKRLLDEGVAKPLLKAVVDANDGPTMRHRAFIARVAARREGQARAARKRADGAARKAARAETDVIDAKARQSAQEARQASRARQAAGAADDAATAVSGASPAKLSKAGLVAEKATTSLDEAISAMATASARLTEAGTQAAGKADELVAARTALQEADRAATQLARRKAGLIAQRDQVWDKLARAYERIGSQGELKSTLDELIDLESKLADLRLGMAEGGLDAAKAAEQVSAIDQTLAPMFEQVKKLEAFLRQSAGGAVDSPAMRNARKQAQDKLRELDDELRAGFQARQAALKQAQAAAPDIPVDLEDAELHLASLFELAETLGDTAMRERLTAIRNTIPQPTGEGLAHAGGSVWHAAPGKASVNTADGLLDGLGPKFVVSNSKAAAQAEMMVENPVVYFPGMDAVWQTRANGDAIVNPALADIAEGADMAPRVVGDMLDLAVRRGLLKAEDFLPASRDQWKQLLDAYDGTIPLERLADDIIGPNAREALFSEATAMRSATQRKVRQAFGRHLAAQGHDSLTYWNGSSWVVQPFEAASINVVGGDRVDALRGLNDGLERAMAKAHDATLDALSTAQKLDQQYGVRIDRLSADLDSAARTAAEQRAKIAQLEQEASDLLARATDMASTSSAVEKLNAEVAFRQQALEMFSAADGFQQQARELRRNALEGIREHGVAAADPQAVQTAITEAEGLAATLRLEAQVAAAEATRAAGRAAKAQGRLDNLAQADPKLVREAMERGWKELGAGSMAPDFIVDSLYEMTRLSHDVPKLLQLYDKALNWFKAWAVATPGFVSRNLVGGVWTNYLAGVDDPMAYRRFTRALRGKGDARTLDLVNQIRDAGILSGGQSTFEGAASSYGRVAHQLRNMGPRQGLNPMKASNYATTAISGASGHVEDFLRGTLAMTVLERGGTMEDAVRATFKYHFNYNDLGKYERDIARRVVPFYTWTRKALPLMVEMMVRQPKGFARYTQAKQNLEATVDEEFTASWIEDSLGIRLPATVNGQGLYLLPDLPMKTLTAATDPVDLTLSGMVPFLKTPLESLMGRRLFNDAPLRDDYEPMPAAWQKIPGLVPALRAIGWVKTSADGTPMITDRRAYQVESAVPLLSRARRMLPSEERYQKRATSTWLSTMTGVATRVNSEADQWSETFNRLERVERQLQEKAQLSGIPRPRGMRIQEYYALVDSDLANQRQRLLNAQAELQG